MQQLINPQSVQELLALSQVPIPLPPCSEKTFFVQEGDTITYKLVCQINVSGFQLAWDIKFYVKDTLKFEKTLKHTTQEEVIKQFKVWILHDQTHLGKPKKARKKLDLPTFPRLGTPIPSAVPPPFSSGNPTVDLDDLIVAVENIPASVLIPQSFYRMAAMMGYRIINDGQRWALEKVS